MSDRIELVIIGLFIVFIAAVVAHAMYLLLVSGEDEDKRDL